MNTYIKRLLIIAALFTTYSCSQDFLDLDPTDQDSVETFWTTEEKAKAALTGCYETLLLGYSFEGFWLIEMDMATPNAWARGNNTGIQAVGAGNNSPDNLTVVRRYQWSYEGVGRANTLLANIGQVQMDEALKMRYKAEARFLRAFYYYNLVEFFGGVPLILDPPDNNKQGQLPRAAKAEVVDAIIADLDAAAEGLPASYPDGDTGRATKGAALALKARAALFNERWADAKDAAQAAIELGVYELFPDYRGIFLLENERNSEVVFDIQFNPPFTGQNYHEAIIGQGGVAPVQNLVDAYLMTDGQPIATSPLYDPDAPYANRDPRLNQTIVTPGSTYNGAQVTGDENYLNVSGYAMKKYTYFKDEEEGVAPPNQNGAINAIVMRYAEVLLTLAEAENELNGPTEIAYEAINQVRSRPSVDMPAVEPGLSQDEFREVVRLERRIEFAGEGLYFHDIMRWRIAEEVMNGPIRDRMGNVLENRFFDPERDYLWPLPAREILLNPNLIQNPGY